jgi:isoleucyl-tRNA synthetase
VFSMSVVDCTFATLMENTRTYNLPHSWRTREATIYHTHGEYANLQSTTLMENTRTYNLPHSWRTREPTIYHTHGEHTNLQSTTLMENTRSYNLPHSWRTREPTISYYQSTQSTEKFFLHTEKIWFSSLLNEPHRLWNDSRVLHDCGRL